MKRIQEYTSEMRIFFSILSIGIVIALAVWWDMQSIKHDTSLLVPTVDSKTGVLIETPIDQAREAKRLIETRNAVLP